MCADGTKNFDEKELEKAKIDILRDAVKDASDTLRAVDRKVFFLTTKTLSIVPIFAAIMLYIKFPDFILPFIQKENITYILIVLGSLPYFYVLSYLLKAAAPKSAPTENFSENDKSFGNSLFYVHTIKNDASPIEFDLENIRVNFDKTLCNENELKKLLIKENIKVSFIRDTKIFNFNKALWHFRNGVIVSSSIILLNFILKMIFS